MGFLLESDDVRRGAEQVQSAADPACVLVSGNNISQMRTANSAGVGVGGFGIRLSLRKAICLHDGGGRRPTGLTLMLRLHFRPRTALGREGRSEKSMRPSGRL